MGVKGLWRLLMPIGRRISLETLTGKVLAIDASIWLTQFLKAMRNPETGQCQAAAHLIGFFRRLCRLHFYGIKPVFVFDGATPEIKQRELAQRRKRREQFATLGDAAVQRLARKLLQENLSKRKQNKMKAAAKDGNVKVTTNGAFAAGFNRGGDQNDQQAKSLDNDDSDDTSAGDEKREACSEQGHEKCTGKNDSADHPHIELLDEEASDKQPAGKHQVSDWDKPIPVDSDDDDDDDKKASSGEPKQDDESSVEYEDFGVTQNSDWMSKRNNNKNLEFDAEAVSSLPADKRKDAIEDAKRRQRLRSRREFMPAAADPLQFSQVQLANFLRSSRLNQSIVTMATKAAEKDNRGLKGDVMASDRTTRIELIREPEEGTREHASAKCGLKRITKSTNVEENDSSDEENWGYIGKQTVNLLDHEEDEDRKPAARIYRRRVIAVGDSSDESDSRSQDAQVGDGFLTSSGEAMADASVENSARKVAPLLFHKDSDDSDAESDVGRGFFKSKDMAATKSSKLTRTNENAKKVTACEDKSDYEGAGGFLTSQDLIVPATLQQSQGFCSEDIGGGFIPSDMNPLGKTSLEGVDPDVEVVAVHKHNNKSDAVLADRALAEAIQASEDAEIAEQSAEGMMSTFTHAKTHNCNMSLLDREHPREFQTTFSICGESGILEVGPEEHKANESDSSDEHDDNIDWEDGDTFDVVQVVPEEAIREGDSGIFSCGQPKQLGVPTQAQHPSSRKDADVPVTANGNSACKEIEDWEDDPYLSSRHISPSKEALSAERAAALERAQATASNLADWAGRVFRRAMKEAGEVNKVEKLEDAEVDAVEKIGNGPIRANEKPATFPTSESVENEESSRKNVVAVATPVRDSAYSGGELKAKAAAHQPTITRFDSIQLQLDERDWTVERNQRERDMDTVTDEMRDEAMRLLQLFGVPFLEAPAEAEAQCVALEELGLVDGIVTDDSDVFVFGGKTVYKNIFDEKKYVEVYLSSDAEREMNLDRNHMIALAMLLGGDYTEGVKGVGIVNSMEVLEAFDVSSDLKKGLQSFKDWLDGVDPFEDLRVASNDTTAMTKQQKFHAKHRTARTRWTTPDSFPSDRVVNAYLHPVVDKSETPFSWGVPDVENIVKFCRTNIGWRAEDTMSFLDPVIEQMKSGYRQTRMESFMRYEEKIKFADIRSKRLREVLGLKEEGSTNKKNRK